MATFVNTAELKNQTNRLLSQVNRGPIVITRRGHPCAALISVREAELEDLLWEMSPRVQSRLRKAREELGRRDWMTAEEFLRPRRAR